MSDLPPIGQDIPVMSVNTDFQEHNWEQHGIHLICHGSCSLITGSNVSQHGATIGYGVQLKGSKGNWSLEMLRGEVKHVTNYAIGRRLAEQKRRELETVT